MKFKLSEATIMIFKTIDRCECCLTFGVGTIFEFEHEDEMVSLSRHGMTITIPHSDFTQLHGELYDEEL